MRYDLFHPKALRAALIEHLGEDYGVPQERQVRRWVSGENPVPGYARQAIAEILAMDTKEAAPAWWAEAAESLVTQIEERMMPTAVPAVPDDLVVRVAQSLAERLGLPEPLDAEAPDAESAKPRGAASKAAKRQR